MPDSITRTSRSDEGILSLTNAVLNDVFGLNDETKSRILKIIRNQGQWQDLKLAIRQMPGVAHRRLNDVINMARQATTDVEAARDAEEHGEEGFNRQHEPGEFDTEGHGHRGRPSGGKFEFEEVREGKVSFAGYLLNELTYDDEDLRDPQKKQDIMRMMRANDAQAEQLKNRAEREQKQSNRQEVTQETDPQRKTLIRKRNQLRQQLAAVEQQLEQGTQQQGTM
jgi:hypothetical protein